VQSLLALKPLAHDIAEAGLVLEAAQNKRWGEAEARALGSAFSDHKLRRLYLRGCSVYAFCLEQGFLTELAAALPALESLSLSRASVVNGESL
jgi:hypothetical protein